jgi:hypothetical protein
VARYLNDHGFDARALRGGYNEWQARFPVEPKGAGVLNRLTSSPATDFIDVS